MTTSRMGRTPASANLNLSWPAQLEACTLFGGPMKFLNKRKCTGFFLAACFQKSERPATESEPGFAKYRPTCSNLYLVRIDLRTVMSMNFLIGNISGFYNFQLISLACGPSTWHRWIDYKSSKQNTHRFIHLSAT